MRDLLVYVDNFAKTIPGNKTAAGTQYRQGLTRERKYGGKEKCCRLFSPQRE
jgi:hypothetical protein